MNSDCASPFQATLKLIQSFNLASRCCRSELVSRRIRNPDEGVLMTKNYKILQLKNSNFLSRSLHEEHLSYRRNLQPSKEKILHFTFLWVISGLPLDPDPGDHNPCRSMRIWIHNTESFVIIVQVKLRTLDLDWKTILWMNPAQPKLAKILRPLYLESARYNSADL